MQISVQFILMVGLLLITIILPSHAQAQRDDGPPAHSFSGTWSLRQSSGHVVTVRLKQNGSEITGTATEGRQSGTVTGRAWLTNGPSGWKSSFDHIYFEIAWTGNVSGVYRASASLAEGNLRGQTHQKGKPSARATWSAGPFARRR